MLQGERAYTRLKLLWLSSQDRKLHSTALLTRRRKECSCADSQAKMKTKSAARSFCTGCCLLSVQPAFILLPSDAFVVPSTTHDALVKQHRHQNQHRHHHRPISPLSTAARRCVLVEDGLVGQGLRRPRTRSDIVPVAMSASSGPGESAPGRGAQSVPSGPGAGVIDLKFRELKTGGFKVFLLFFLLGVSKK